MPELVNYVKLPRSRIGVVIGPKGSTKKMLEKELKCSIDIDSQTGEVRLTTINENVDPVLRLKAGEVIKAIGRGFTPEQALQLLKDNFYLEVISLKQQVGNSQKALHRIRSRLIGTDGKTRKTIEEYTKTSVVVMGSTASIIGDYIGVMDAMEAINKLIAGAKQPSVYAWLEERRKERIRNESDPTWKSENLAGYSMEEVEQILKEDTKELDLEDEFAQLIEDEKSQDQ